MKKSLRAIITMVAVIATVIALVPKSVYAEPVTSVVMKYEDKVYTKQIYGIEIDQIKGGAETDGLRDIGGLLDNLTFQTNGDVKVNKSAVINAVKTAIIAGQTGINIDLTKYTEDALKSAASAAASNPTTGANAADAAAATTTAQTATVALPGLESMGIDCKLSEASTRFRANEDRAQNIRNAASKINGMVIQPGQLFSATTAFGPRTVANGYGLGNVISGTTYVKGIGGGICQVSSTLNLAMLRAGVAPMERHNHSHRSSYIGSGLDATISGTALDYKFVNPYEYPLYISAVTNGGVISISIYSSHNATGGVTYEPVVVGGKMSNTTHIVGKLAGVQVSDRIAYSSRYRQ